MVKVFNPIFTIDIVSKKKESKSSKNKISRKCLATVIKENGEYKAVINYNHKKLDITDTFTLNNELLVIPFTERSLDLKGKERVWLKNKDKYGYNVCVIRDYFTANLSPGLPTQYDAVKENILIAGHIIKINEKMYFEYEDLIANHYNAENYIQSIDIDESKPLFIK